MTVDEPTLVVLTRCQHPTFSEQDYRDWIASVAATWGDTTALRCPDCDDYVYPHDDGEKIVVYDEPYGAGRD